MSITKTRNFLEKSGCGWFVGIGLVIVFAVSFLWQGAGPRGGVEDQEQSRGAVIASIGDYAITESMIDNARNQAREQGYPPLGIPYQVATALKQALDRGLMLELARQKGIEPTDDQILDDAKSKLEMQLTMAKAQLQQQGKTEADLEKQVKQQTGMTIAEMTQKQLDETRKQLDDPLVRASLAAETADPLVKTAVENSIQAKDEDVRRAQGTLVTKSISFKPDSEAMAKAEKVLKEIRGGLSFEAAMDRYSTSGTPLPKGKKMSDMTEDLSMTTVEFDPSHKSLRDLKPGQISNVIVTASGPKIYKIVAFKEYKKDLFEKSKASYVRSYVSQLANQQIAKEIEASRGKIKWDSAGYKLMYDWVTDISNSEITMAERDAVVRKYWEEAKAATKTVEGSGQEAVDMVLYATTEAVWEKAKNSKAERDKIVADRADILSSVYDQDPDQQVGLDLIDMLIELKDKGAAAKLLDVAQGNNTYDQIGMTRDKQIAERLAKLKKGGLVTAEEEKQIVEEQKRWRTEKAEDEKEKKIEAEELKKQEAEDKKKEAAEKKRIAEENKKKLEDSGKASKGPVAPPKPKPSTTGR